MPGEDLAIKSFSCHPNPFSAKQDNNGSTIQTIRFAFLLTDVAKEAKIVLYTIANRIVWTWQKTDGTIGYQEVPWNGKTSQGYRIANGTYYAKLTVKNDSKKATSIIRIAKLEGY
jgi:flagellar hook assembly protein FlgD